MALWFLFFLLCCGATPPLGFSGFKVECQIPASLPRQYSFHLTYFLDNKLVWDHNLGTQIPWTEPLALSQNMTVVLARRKTYALRQHPIYIPNQVVGAIFDGDTAVSPLVLENIWTKYWVQASLELAVIHVPVLTTPRVDLPKYDHAKLDWAKYIKADESYSYEGFDAFKSRVTNVLTLPGDYMLVKMFLMGRNLNETWPLA